MRRLSCKFSALGGALSGRFVRKWGGMQRDDVPVVDNADEGREGNAWAVRLAGELDGRLLLAGLEAAGLSNRDLDALAALLRDLTRLGEFVVSMGALAGLVVPDPGSFGGNSPYFLRCHIGAGAMPSERRSYFRLDMRDSGLDKLESVPILW